MKAKAQWPLEQPTPDELATAGFYYLEDGDKAKCFHCTFLMESDKEKCFFFRWRWLTTLVGSRSTLGRARQMVPSVRLCALA